MKDPVLAEMFVNCFPNTLDTTVEFTEADEEGHPDTFVITGDIEAMWYVEVTDTQIPIFSFQAQRQHESSLALCSLCQQVLFIWLS